MTKRLMPFCAWVQLAFFTVTHVFTGCNFSQTGEQGASDEQGVGRLLCHFHLDGKKKQECLCREFAKRPYSSEEDAKKCQSYVVQELSRKMGASEARCPTTPTCPFGAEWVEETKLCRLPLADVRSLGSSENSALSIQPYRALNQLVAQSGKVFDLSRLKQSGRLEVISQEEFAKKKGLSTSLQKMGSAYAELPFTEAGFAVGPFTKQATDSCIAFFDEFKKAKEEEFQTPGVSALWDVMLQTCYTPIWLYEVAEAVMRHTKTAEGVPERGDCQPGAFKLNPVTNLCVSRCPEPHNQNMTGLEELIAAQSSGESLKGMHCYFGPFPNDFKPQCSKGSTLYYNMLKEGFKRKGRGLWNLEERKKKLGGLFFTTLLMNHSYRLQRQERMDLAIEKFAPTKGANQEAAATAFTYFNWFSKVFMLEKTDDSNNRCARPVPSDKDPYPFRIKASDGRNTSAGATAVFSYANGSAFAASFKTYKESEFKTYIGSSAYSLLMECEDFGSQTFDEQFVEALTESFKPLCDQSLVIDNFLTSATLTETVKARESGKCGN